MYFAGQASGNSDYWKTWTKNGDPLTKLTNVQAVDFRDPANVDLFMNPVTGGVDKRFWDPPNLTPGVVAMFTVRPGAISTATGHVFSIQDANYNDDGSLSSLTYIEGHMKYDPEKDKFESKIEFMDYLDEWQLDFYGTGTLRF